MTPEYVTIDGVNYNLEGIRRLFEVCGIQPDEAIPTREALAERLLLMMQQRPNSNSMPTIEAYVGRGRVKFSGI